MEGIELLKAHFKRLKKEGICFNLLTNLWFIFLCATIIIPLWLCVTISLSDTTEIIKNGYSLFPKNLSLEAYRYIMANGREILNAYKVTIFVTVAGTVLGSLVTGMYAYAVYRPDFAGRKFFNYFIFIPTLFGGGLVASYLWNTSIGLYDNYAALIIPGLMNAWNVIMLRAFFQTSIPFSLIESAKLDGAGEFRIFFKIACPISVPGIATIALFLALGYWNDWYTYLIYIRNEDLYGLQFYLQRIMKNLQMLTSAAVTNTTSVDVPSESVRMAICLVAIGPIIAAYPFVQKYLVQGLTVGAVKG